MGPLDLRAEVQAVPPMARARVQMEAQEAAEERQREAEAYNKLARAEALQLQIVSRQRVELMRDGETTEDRIARETEQAQIRQARIDELNRQLDRLDPARAGVQRAQAQQIQIDATLRRSQQAAERGWAVISRVRQQAGEPMVSRDDPRPAHCGECRQVGASLSESRAMHADSGDYITRSAPLSTLTALTGQ